jgi:hypothetical protein
VHECVWTQGNVTVGLTIQLVQELGKNNSMIRGSKYRCTSRYEVQHLDIVEDILDED